MPRIDADFTDVVIREALPKDVYVCRVAQVDLTKTKNPPYNPMMVPQFVVDDGEHTGRRLTSWIVYAGKQKRKDANGMESTEPVVPFGLARLIEATKVPWACRACSSPFRVTDFLWGTENNGLKKGQMYCPDCKQPTQISVDSDSFINQRLKIAVDVEKIPDSDRMGNRVKGYSPLD